MDFIAIDVETANSNMASICAIGVARFSGGLIVDEWYSLIDPQSHFDGINVSIHGITSESVKGAPKFGDVFASLDRLVGDRVVITHTHFDRVALRRASNFHGLPLPSWSWLDTARVARRAWDVCAQKGYGLANVCSLIGYEFQHHNALEDAKAAGHVLLAAIEKTGVDLQGWSVRVDQPLNGTETGKRALAGNPAGRLFGESIVFTGALMLPRAEASALAAALGCDVQASVSSKTTMLVVGDIDLKQLAGHEKSSKHRKAETLISQGQALRIMQESDFLDLVSLN